MIALLEKMLRELPKTVVPDAVAFLVPRSTTAGTCGRGWQKWRSLEMTTGYPAARRSSRQPTRAIYPPPPAPPPYPSRCEMIPISVRLALSSLTWQEPSPSSRSWRWL